MNKTKARNLKGFRDFLPDKMYVRKYVLSILEQVFESFGYQPLQTPTLEYAEVLTGKYGDEADKLMYLFKDQGGRKVGLNYDLTVPTARVLAEYQSEIPLPFKRYQIQPSYRAENTQKGRYRQFIQCDIDCFGISSPLADAEIIAIIYDCLKKLNFRKFTIRINSRQVLFTALEELNINDKKTQLSILQSIDKLDKKSEQEVINELADKGIEQTLGKKLISLIQNSVPDENLKQVFKNLEELGIDKNFYQFVPFIVRGLDYYTGVIFETYVEEPKIGSITGGGRYDQLVKQLGGPNMPATGATIGFERICDVIEELGLLTNQVKNFTKVLVTIFSKDLQEKSIEISSLLRSKNIPTELWLEPEAKLDKQLKYADQKKIPYAIIIGPDEAKSGKVTLKNLQTQTQETLTLDEATQKLTS